MSTIYLRRPIPIYFVDDLASFLAFYDGQPRTSDGRFTFGKMPKDALRCSLKGIPEIILNGNKFDDTLKELQKRYPEEETHHHKDVGDFIITKVGLRHALRECPSRNKTRALWHLGAIIDSVQEFHFEEPHPGKSDILGEMVGTTSIAVDKHIFSATVTIEQAKDGIWRFHHLRINRKYPTKNAPVFDTPKR